MAGFREFLTGEVLTAANVNNFLMKQSVMVFADDAARTSALGAEVVEGMLTYNEDTAQLEVFDGAAFIAAGSPGIGSNVVQTVKTDVFTTGSIGMVEVTDLTVTITPTSATSKILVMGMLNGGLSGGGRRGFVSVFRGATNLSNPDSPGSRTINMGGITTAGSSNGIQNSSLAFLDNPTTTDAVTYSIRVAAGESGNVFFVNRGEDDTNAASRGRAVSSITVIEVAA